MSAIKLANGGELIPQPNHEVRCEVHGTITTWGKLDPIQQLAVESGIDTLPDEPCLLLTSK